MNKEELIKVLTDIFYLSDDDKETVFWKAVDRKYFRSNTAHKIHLIKRANKPAGTLRPDGYIAISWKQTKYSAHHIAFGLKNGRWPNENCEIDHENRKRDDNSRLREVSKQENLENRGGIFNQFKPKKRPIRFALDDEICREADTSVLGDDAENGAKNGVNDDVMSEADINVLGFNKNLILPEREIVGDYALIELAMIDISKIETISDRQENLSIRTTRSKIDRVILAEEIEADGFTFFDELHVVKKEGEDRYFLADGYMRLEIYKTKTDKKSVPCKITTIPEHHDISTACRAISADLNSRPRAQIDKDTRMECLYQEIWKKAEIENGKITWPNGIGKLAKFYRVGKNIPKYMKSIVEYLTRNEIDRISYKADRIIYNEKKITRDEQQIKNLEEEEIMMQDAMKLIQELKKSNSFCHVMKNPESRAILLEELCGNENDLKEAIEARFNISATLKDDRKKAPIIKQEKEAILDRLGFE